MTLTQDIVTSLLLDGTNSVFVRRFKTVFWAKNITHETEKQPHRRPWEKMPLRVMQGDKCDFEVFFNNAAEKSGVIGQTGAGNHWRTESFFAFGNCFTLSQIRYNWLQERIKTFFILFYLLVHQCLIIPIQRLLGDDCLEFSLRLFHFPMAFDIQQVT